MDFDDNKVETPKGLDLTEIDTDNKKATPEQVQFINSLFKGFESDDEEDNEDIEELEDDTSSDSLVEDGTINEDVDQNFDDIFSDFE